MNIQDHVIMLDTVPKHELPPYLMAADCVVTPSLTEGFGFTAVEACAMGRPVVVSDTDSLPEVVSGRYILVEPGNPYELAGGIVSVYRGELKAGRLKRFPVEDMTVNYLDLYHGLVGKVHSGTPGRQTVRTNRERERDA